MPMKSVFLALSLVSTLAVPAAMANERYRERPPVVVSPDLSAPWVVYASASTSTIRRVASGMAALIPSAIAQAVASSSKMTMACANVGEPGSRPQ